MSAIDNYDSFVYNLVQYLGELIRARGGKIQVFRNDNRYYGYYSPAVGAGSGSTEEGK